MLSELIKIHIFSMMNGKSSVKKSSAKVGGFCVYINTRMLRYNL